MTNGEFPGQGGWLKAWSSALKNAMILSSALLSVGLPLQVRAENSEQAFEDLGEGQYRVGQVKVDRNKSEFTISGSVIELQFEGAPLEFLAITTGTEKAYESLITIDATGTEFNLACILIGLDSDDKSKPEHHYDPEPLKGISADVVVSWEHEGRTVRAGLADLITGYADDFEDDWVYTGSFFSGEYYLADTVGVLIGFVHNPISVIEHRQGVGVGQYGSITANLENLPPAGTPIVLTVSRSDAQAAVRR